MLNKLILLLYFVITYIEDKTDISNILYLILLLLVYVIINVLKGIVENKKIKSALLLVSMMFLICGYFFINPLFVILIPLNIFELIDSNVRVEYIILSIVLIMFLINRSIIFEFLYCSVFSSIFYELSRKSAARIVKLTNDNELLTERNAKLLEGMHKDEDYENQIRYSSQLEERNKIAQEIHDKLGHTISASIMQLEAAQMLIECDLEKSKQMIASSIGILRNGMESIRSTLKSIKPAIEQMGINKLKLLVNSFITYSGMNAKLSFDGDLNMITYSQWKVIYDNVNEALTNAMKYSGANNVKVNIQVLNKLVKTEIKDDGKGSKYVIKGLGISGIEERTENLSGKVIIDSSDGFSIILLLPIEKN